MRVRFWWDCGTSGLNNLIWKHCWLCVFRIISLFALNIFWLINRIDSICASNPTENCKVLLCRSNLALLLLPIPGFATNLPISCASSPCVLLPIGSSFSSSLSLWLFSADSSALGAIKLSVASWKVSSSSFSSSPSPSSSLPPGVGALAKAKKTGIQSQNQWMCMVNMEGWDYSHSKFPIVEWWWLSTWSKNQFY